MNAKKVSKNKEEQVVKNVSAQTKQVQKSTKKRVTRKTVKKAPKKTAEKKNVSANKSVAKTDVKAVAPGGDVIKPKPVSKSKSKTVATTRRRKPKAKTSANVAVEPVQPHKQAKTNDDTKEPKEPVASKQQSDSAEQSQSNTKTKGRLQRRRGNKRYKKSNNFEADDNSSDFDDDADLDEAIEADNRIRRILVNVSDLEEARVAILADKELDNLSIETTSSEKYRGNIYKGRVVNIKESMQAAFIDFGGDKNGFLHVSDVLPIYGGVDGGKMLKHERRIQNLLHKDQTILVQVTKEGVGNKGPALTTYLSLPGRYLVMMPNMSSGGISRKIEDQGDRNKVRKLLKSMNPPEGIGFIARTQSIGCSVDDLRRDLAALLELWADIVVKNRDQSVPSVLYQESDLVTRTIRDYYSPDIKEIWVDNKECFHNVRDFFRRFMSDHVNRVKYFDGKESLFKKFGIEHEIDKLNHNKVPLVGGAYLVIDQTEAMVTIDVNSGKFTDIKDAEKSSYRTNMLAAKEIPKQLRLRDLGGLVIIDFIDMREGKHRRNVERELRKYMRSDKARFKVLRMSQFCLVEMTRQRLKPSKQHAMYVSCPSCRGTGLIKSIEAMSIYILRKIREGVRHQSTEKIEVLLNSAVADFLLNVKRSDMAELERLNDVEIYLSSDPSYEVEQFNLKSYKKDAKKPVVTEDGFNV